MRKSIIAAAAFVALLLSPASPALAKGTAHRSVKVHCTTKHRCRATRKGHRSPAPKAHRKHASKPHRRASVRAAGTRCDKVASPTGSDASGNGSLSSPYATVAKLDSSLAPGQAGCLLGGTYGSTHTEFYLGNSGTAGGQITITAYPGQQAKLVGFVDLMASHTTLSGLQIDGSNTFYNIERPGTRCPYPVSQGLQINGSDDVFENNDYYQSIASLRGNGIGVGWNGTADNTVIRYNRIHDVGQCQAYDHLIYLSHGTGTQIYDNWLWNDPHGFGVQVYPQVSGAHIFDNVIDHAGSGFTVGGTSATSDNEIDNNVVMDSTGLSYAGTTGVGILDWWEGTPGSGNTFVDNDCYDNPAGVASVSAVRLSGNFTAEPDMVDSSAHDYNVKSGSPVAHWSLWRN